MAPGFFRKLFTKIKEIGRKVIDGGKKILTKVVDVAPKIAPVIAPIADKIHPGAGAAIQGFTSGLQALQPIFKGNKYG